MLDLRNNIEQSESTTIYIENRRGYERNVLACYMIMDASDVMSKRCSSSYHYGSLWSV
jgi:hypothetical protein